MSQAIHIPKPGEASSQILREAVAHGLVVSTSKSALQLNARGLLTRDKKDGTKWYPTDKGREAVQKLDGVATMEVRVDQARRLFADGDIMAARQLSEALYSQSKAGGQFAKKFRLGDHLEACRRIQGDAAEIVVQAKIRIYEGWKEAGDEGKTNKGRPKSVGHENAFTAEEIGLTRQDIHEGKKWKEAQDRQPGIVQQAIASLIAAGLEPSKRSLRAAIGAKTATKEERGDNLYQTPPEAVHALLALEDFSPTIWEPACGRGAISRILETCGYKVELSDLNDYETADQFGALQDVQDFLQTEPGPRDGLDIVTNPPYGEHLNAFVAHALRVHRPKKMALLVNVNFWGGTNDPDRTFALTENPPSRFHWNIRRLPMMNRDGWEGPEASSSMNTAWLVWELQPDGTYGNQTIITRVDWKSYLPAVDVVAAESEAA